MANVAREASVARDLETLARRIRAVADAFDGVMGVALTFLPTGEGVFVRADDVFPTASVIKIAIVAELFTQAAEGFVSLDERITVTDEAMVAGSGVLSLLTPGLALGLRDLAVLAIAVSDNTASNLVLARVGGPDAVNRRMRQGWEMTATAIHRPICFSLGPDDPPHTATGTPRDQMQLLTLLAKGRVHSREVSDQVLCLLAETQASDMLPRYLPVHPYAEEIGAPQPVFVVRHKTGAVTGVRNDASLIARRDEQEQTLAICVFTRDGRDARWTAANAGAEAVAEIARLASGHFFRVDKETGR